MHESTTSDPPCCDCGEYLSVVDGVLQCPTHGSVRRTRVVNISFERCDAYIGRGSKWGNPFHIGQHGTREEVIALYRNYLLNSPLLSHLSELRGKTLGCHCKPLPCHGDILVELIESDIRGY